MSNFVQNRNGTYYFRRVVPSDLRPHFGGRREWTYSLRTKDKREADRQARLDAVALDHQILEAETALAAARASGPSVFKPMSQAFEMSEGDFEHMLLAAENTDHLNNEYEAREPDRRSIIAALASGEERVTVNGLALQDILRDVRYEGEAATEQAKIARYLARDAAEAAPEVVPSSETIARAPAHKPASEQYLTDIIPKWAAERRVAAKTVDAHKAVARWFEEKAGHVALVNITRSSVLSFKDKMLAEGVTPANANVKLTRLRTLLNFAENNDLIASNPAKGVVVIDRDAARNRRKPFDRDALAAIFGSPVFSQDFRPKDGRGEAAYWLPLLALYTGARLEELGQMRPSDIVLEPFMDEADTDQSAWVLRITEDETDGLRLKNSGSERTVPVHPDLEGLGFAKFAQAACDAGQARLFPALRPDKYGRLTAKWGEWFGKYKREVCGISDRRLVFHSFRHTFKDQARDAGIADAIQRKLMGHSGSDEADKYGGGHGMYRLVEAMKTYRVAGFNLPAPPPSFR